MDLRKFLVILILLFSAKVSAESIAEETFFPTATSSYKLFYLLTSYQNYAAIKKDGGVDIDTSEEVVEWGEMYKAELGYYVHRLFCLNVYYATNMEGNRTGVGAGIKISMPGFFLIGGNVQELVQPRHPKFLSYILASYAQYAYEDHNGITTIYRDNVFGLGTDWRIFKPVFLNFQIATHSFLGNYLLEYSAGLGFEF